MSNRDDLIYYIFLIIMRYLIDIGKIKEPTDDELKKGMQDVKDSVDKWNK